MTAATGLVPRDVARMLERRGYRVRDVNFERGRYFVRAHAAVLRYWSLFRVAAKFSKPAAWVVIVIGDRRQNGFSIEINPAY